MSIQISIVGLGQIGASVGLALGKRRSDIRRVGHDKSPEIAKKAQQIGAVDDVKFNLPASVRDANIVLLSLPISEVRATMETIAQDLREGVVVLGITPVQKTVAEWAQELLPAGRHFVSLAPAINPMYLHRIDLGVDAAAEDLFEKGVMMLSTLSGVPEQAVKVATDLIEIVGARPVFGDMPEIDSLMSSTHIVPQLVAAALLNAVVDQPGWRESRQLAGRPFSALTSALAYQDEVHALGEAAIANRESVTRVLDVMIASLQGMRNDIANGNRDDVFERLELASEGHQRWLAQRMRDEWQSDEHQVDLRNLPSFWERILGSRKRPGKD